MDKLELIIHEYPENEDIIKDGMSIRFKVFIDEQKFEASGEKDGQEKNSIHFILYNDKTPIEKYFKLSRLAILKEHRGKGYASYMMTKMIEYLKNKNCKRIYCESQVQVVDFYKKHGFKVISDVVMIEDYPHKKLELLLQQLIQQIK